jgi:hypothetical protein
MLDYTYASARQFGNHASGGLYRPVMVSSLFLALAITLGTVQASTFGSSTIRSASDGTSLNALEGGGLTRLESNSERRRIWRCLSAKISILR